MSYKFIGRHSNFLTEARKKADNYYREKTAGQNKPWWVEKFNKEDGTFNASLFTKFVELDGTIEGTGEIGALLDKLLARDNDGTSSGVEFLIQLAGSDDTEKKNYVKKITKTYYNMTRNPESRRLIAAALNDNDRSDAKNWLEIAQISRSKLRIDEVTSVEEIKKLIDSEQELIFENKDWKVHLIKTARAANFVGHKLYPDGNNNEIPTWCIAQSQAQYRNGHFKRYSNDKRNPVIMFFKNGGKRKYCIIPTPQTKYPNGACQTARNNSMVEATVENELGTEVHSFFKQYVADWFANDRRMTIDIAPSSGIGVSAGIHLIKRLPVPNSEDVAEVYYVKSPSAIVHFPLMKKTREKGSGWFEPEMETLMEAKKPIFILVYGGHTTKIPGVVASRVKNIYIFTSPTMGKMENEGIEFLASEKTFDKQDYTSIYQTQVKIFNDLMPQFLPDIKNFHNNNIMVNLYHWDDLFKFSTSNTVLSQTNENWIAIWKKVTAGQTISLPTNPAHRHLMGAMFLSLCSERRMEDLSIILKELIKLGVNVKRELIKSRQVDGESILFTMFSYNYYDTKMMEKQIDLVTEVLDIVGKEEVVAIGAGANEETLMDKILYTFTNSGDGTILRSKKLTGLLEKVTELGGIISPKFMSAFVNYYGFVGGSREVICKMVFDMMLGKKLSVDALYGVDDAGYCMFYQFHRRGIHLLKKFMAGGTYASLFDISRTSPAYKMTSNEYLKDILNKYPNPNDILKSETLDIFKKYNDGDVTGDQLSSIGTYFLGIKDYNILCEKFEGPCDIYPNNELKFPIWLRILMLFMIKGDINCVKQFLKTFLPLGGIKEIFSNEMSELILPTPNNYEGEPLLAYFMKIFPPSSGYFTTGEVLEYIEKNPKVMQAIVTYPLDAVGCGLWQFAINYDYEIFEKLMKNTDVGLLYYIPVEGRSILSQMLVQLTTDRIRNTEQYIKLIQLICENCPNYKDMFEGGMDMTKNSPNIIIKSVKFRTALNKFSDAQKLQLTEILLGKQDATKLAEQPVTLVEQLKALDSMSEVIQVLVETPVTNLSTADFGNGQNVLHYMFNRISTDRCDQTRCLNDLIGDKSALHRDLTVWNNLFFKADANGITPFYLLLTKLTVKTTEDIICSLNPLGVTIKNVTELNPKTGMSIIHLLVVLDRPELYLKILKEIPTLVDLMKTTKDSRGATPIDYLKKRYGTKVRKQIPAELLTETNRTFKKMLEEVIDAEGFF